MIINYLNKIPHIAPHAYIFKDTTVIGDVKIGRDSSIWFRSVVRGDVNSIFIGERTNIQDNSTIHVTTDLFPTHVGNEVTIGHNVVIHGSKIGHRSLIGMGAAILDGCNIGEDCIIAANSVLLGGTVIPDGVLVAGNPGKIKRELRQDEIDHLKRSASNYVNYSRNYLTSAPNSIYSSDEIKVILETLKKL